MCQKQLKSPKEGLVPGEQPEAVFSRTWSFCKVLDNLGLGLNMKIQETLIAEFRDMSKNLQKCPQNGGFSQFVTAQDFFRYWYPTHLR